MARQGINIEFRNLTKGHHFDMVQGALGEKGSFYKQSDKDLVDFYKGVSSYNLRRDTWGGIVYTVALTYDVKNDKLIADCGYY